MAERNKNETAMKKLLVLLVILLMAGVNLFADNHQQQIELTYDKRPPKIDKPKDRSLHMSMDAFLNFPYLAFYSNMQEEQEANIYVLNANDDVVMSEIVLLFPCGETSLYIGDLPNGIYQLVIELEDAVLSGTFLI